MVKSLSRLMVLAVLSLFGIISGSALTGCSGQFIPDIAGETVTQATPLLAYPISSIEAAHWTDGQIHYAYELALINMAKSPVTLENIDVVNRQSPDGKYASFPASAIPAMLKKAGAGASDNRLDPGQGAYLMVDLTFSENDPQPVELAHIVKIATQDSRFPLESVQTVAYAQVVSTPAVRIGPPLKGDRWIAAVIGPGQAHRTAVMPINGKWVTPERWAVDWVQVTPDNFLVTGDPTLNESYPQYGQDIIAVANGPVVAARDGMPDLTAGKGPEKTNLAEAAGNYVLQDIGNGLCAVYAHLKPGSVQVKAGQVLQKGEKLGLLGNSGNSTGPHLHFHILRGRAPLDGDGVPYIIEQFRVQGTINPDEDLEKATLNRLPIHPLWFTEPEPQRHRMPANVAIISF